MLFRSPPPPPLPPPPPPPLPPPPGAPGRLKLWRNLETICDGVEGGGFGAVAVCVVVVVVALVLAMVDDGEYVYGGGAVATGEFLI